MNLTSLFNLAGKSALVCGSSQGIGLASAQILAQMGARIVLLARNEHKLKDALAMLPSSTQPHQYLVADFAVVQEAHSVVKQYLEAGDTIDILINNTRGPDPGPASTASPEQFRKAFELHLINNHELAMLCLPGMKERGFGRIINIISTSVKIPLPNLGVSNTIRAAVANWSKTLANEVAPYGVTVNNVLPGATLTTRLEGIIKNKASKQGLEDEAVAKHMMDEIPAGRFGTAHEIAAAVGFLASPDASYITGINIPVDGGRTGSL